MGLVIKPISDPFPKYEKLIALFVSLTQVPAAAAESAAICLVVVHFAAAAADSATSCYSFRKRSTLPQSQPHKVDLVMFVWLPQTQFSFISYFNFMNL